MDFIENLGDTNGTLEIPVDAIGRAEILNDRVRLTLVTYRGEGPPAPAVCVVWTVAGLKSNRRNYQMLHELLAGHLAEPEVVKLITGGAMHH